MHTSSGHHDDEHGIAALPQQASLFEQDVPSAPATPPRTHFVEVPSLSAESPLGACRLPYAEFLRHSDKSANTIACFLSDLSVLIGYLGSERPLSSISRADLESWRTHLKHEGHARGEHPAPKTIARRMTFLKNFFGWLAAQSVVAQDPTAELRFQRPSPPLGEILFEHEVARLVESSRHDVRSEALVMLLLDAGLKREELLGLRARDVDLSDPEHPAIEVHFPGRDKRRRERRLAMPPTWSDVYTRYVERFRPAQHVFECTPRNLNYVLDAAVRAAGLHDSARPVTMRTLRDVYAVRQLRAGVPPDTLRERLGLSEEAWVETYTKLRKLAFPA